MTLRKIIYLIVLMIIPLIGGCEKEVPEDVITTEEGYFSIPCEICPEELDFEGLWLGIYSLIIE